MNEHGYWLHRFEYSILRFFADRAAAGGMPRVRRLGKWLGALMWHLLPGRRAFAIASIQERLNLPPQTAHSIARQSFCHNGCAFMEIVLGHQANVDWPHMHIAQPERHSFMQTVERPVVYITGHLGAWEMLAGMLGTVTSHRPRCTIVRSHNNPAVWRFIVEQRSNAGTMVLGHRDAMGTVLKVLRQNGSVGVLVDHNTKREEAIFLPFLGKTASVNLGPALLAVRTKALVCPAFVLRDAGGYTLHLEETLDTATLSGTAGEKIEQVARFYTEAMERAVRANPEQWFWMHKRWKTQPE